jgi:thiamine biosynthesis lipoprotein ApbE
MSPLPPRARPRLARTAAAGLTVLVGGRTALFALGGPALPPGGVAQQQRLALEEFNYGQDDVLGTSLDLIVCAARPGDAARCHEAVLAEIERLRGILSTYDPASEISRVSLGLQPAAAPELRQLLAAYDAWSARTGGAVDARLGNVVRLWREAARTGRWPDPAALRAALHAPGALNVDALGKAAIIDRAVAVARRLAPAGLLNLGGDLRGWGDVTWTIGVADPVQPAENAPVLTTFPLRDAAVATSGDYARPFMLAGRAYSHLIDPRTLQPAGGTRSATVVATDCLTANALAAALSVMGPPGAASLADLGRTLGHLLVDRAGTVSRGGIFATTAATSDSSPPQATTDAGPATTATAPGATAPVASAVAAKPAAPAPWPKGFQVAVNLLIGGSAGKGYRPYVAFWVEDTDGRMVRTLCLLGDDTRFINHLTGWRNASRDAYYVGVTRATRPNGLYTVVWDGLDDDDRPVPQGTYRVCVELVREQGRHTSTTATVVCDDQPHTVDLAATVESGASKVEFGPKPVVSAKPATPMDTPKINNPP